jgi:hypothetical protein
MRGLAEVPGPHLLEELGQSGHLLSEEVRQRIIPIRAHSRRALGSAQGKLVRRKRAPRYFRTMKTIQRLKGGELRFQGLSWKI